MTSKNLFKQFNLKAKRLKRAAIAVFAFFIFLIAFYSGFFSQQVSEKDVPNYNNLKVDSYQEYQKSITDTRNGIKNLMENKQLEHINYYKDIFSNLKFEGKNNPFVKFPK